MQRGPIEEDYRGPLLFIAVLLGLGVERLGGAVLEGHVLQFALAAGIAYRAIEGMIAQQQLDGGFARLGDLVAFGGDDHAFGYRGGAGGLQLGHFFQADQAHAASCLQREAGVVAKLGDGDAGLAAGLDQQSACGCGELFAVDGKGYVSHGFLSLLCQTPASAASGWWA